MPSLLPPWSVPPPVSVCGPDSGGTRPGFTGSLVRLMEHRKEYQLKGHKYLRAEIFNNLRPGQGGWSRGLTRYKSWHGKCQWAAEEIKSVYSVTDGPGLSDITRLLDVSHIHILTY